MMSETANNSVNNSPLLHGANGNNPYYKPYGHGHFHDDDVNVSVNLDDSLLDEASTDTFSTVLRTYLGKIKVTTPQSFSRPMMTFVFALSGVVSAAVAVALFYCLQSSDRFIGDTPYLYTNQTPLIFLVLPCGFIGINFLLRTVFAGAEGSGIPQAKIFYDEVKQPNDNLGFRVLFGKFFLTVLLLFLGGSAGKEGPTVAMSCSVFIVLVTLSFKLFPEITKSSFSGKKGDDLEFYVRAGLVASSAAGIATTFSTVLGGIVFSIEEFSSTWNPRFGRLTLVSVVSATMSVFLMSYLIDKDYEDLTYYGFVYSHSTVTELLTCSFGSGLFGGFLGGVNCTLLILGLKFKALTKRRSASAGYAWAVFGGLSLAGIGWLTDGKVYGEGTLYVQQVLTTDVYCATNETDGGDYEHPSQISEYGAMKMLATTVTYLSGVCGGIFAPSFSAGAGFGTNYYCLVSRHIHPGIDVTFVVLLTMVGFFSGLTQCPLTSFTILVGMLYIENEPQNQVTCYTGMLCSAVIGSFVSKLFNPMSLYDAMAEVIVEGNERDLKPVEKDWALAKFIRERIFFQNPGGKNELLTEEIAAASER